MQARAYYYYFFTIVGIIIEFVGIYCIVSGRYKNYKRNLYNEKIPPKKMAKIRFGAILTVVLAGGVLLSIMIVNEARDFKYVWSGEYPVMEGCVVKTCGQRDATVYIKDNITNEEICIEIFNEKVYIGEEITIKYMPNMGYGRVIR